MMNNNYSNKDNYDGNNNNDYNDSDNSKSNNGH